VLLEENQVGFSAGFIGFFCRKTASKLPKQVEKLLAKLFLCFANKT